nr:MAG TPA: hypothetical protein [Bacteriophage sp.]
MVYLSQQINKAGDTYQANTGTQKERQLYYSTGEKK